MKASEITDEQFIQAMYEVVKGNQDFVYTETGNSCVYVNNDGSPSCLIGHALMRCGTEAEFFEGINRDPVSVIEHLFSSMSESVLESMFVAQLAQDHGETWGQALGRFERTLETYNEDH